LIANTLPPDDLSGVGEQVLQLAAGLRDSGHEVEVLGRSRSRIGRVKFLFPLTVVIPAARRLTRFRPHVVQVHESDGALVCLWVRVVRALLSPSARIVALLQVSYLEEWRSVRPLRYGGRVLGRPGWRELRFKWIKAPLQIALGCLSAYLADVVLAPSRQTARELERDYRLSRVEVFPNVMGGRRIDVEADPAIGSSEGFLLYVGRLRIRKGVEVLLESLATMKGEPIRLVIVGDGEHEGRLRRTAAALGLGRSVQFLGRRSPGQVRYLMGRAAALVVPSIYEGMPLVILEAMEAGLPIIASAVSGIPEVVEDGVVGWLVPAENPGALADAVGELVADSAAARRRGEAGRERLASRFSAGRAATTWNQIFVETGPAAGAQSGRLEGRKDVITS
jgi:glycosyltransferase involved in cell wall biosynthesis